jgi:hypothetical protein
MLCYGYTCICSPRPVRYFVSPGTREVWNEGSLPRDCGFGCRRCCVLPMRLHTVSGLVQLIHFLEVRGRLSCRMGAALACAVPCGIRRSPSFDRVGSLTTSKQRWMRHLSRALSLHIRRWRFQERVRSRSISREMWITGCGNYDFRLNESLEPTAFGGG